MGLVALPIDEMIPKILASFEKASNLILTASPGAGKTTRLPPELLHVTKKKILVLEPRRVAAIAAAERIAQEQGWRVGSEVGYQVRLDACFTDQTRLIFLTEALLQKRLLKDPELSDVGVVVLDEFHERSLHVDLALGFLRELQELGRPDLKIVIMSATLDTEQLQKFLPQAELISVPGKTFPLEVIYQKTPQILNPSYDWLQKVGDAIKDAVLSSQTGRHVLVFLPGSGEIERLAQTLETKEWLRDRWLCKLHGQLSLEKQLEVLRPSDKQKIILATNVAESSVTVDGLDTVVDTGLVKRARWNWQTGFQRLETGRVSLSSATQRAGRAARQFPGRCFRLWTVHDELSMTEHDPADVTRSDLSEAVLFLSALGVKNPLSFSWFESPPKMILESTSQKLVALGAVSATGEITEKGRKLLGLPFDVTIGNLYLALAQRNLATVGIDLGLILQERDLLTSQGFHGSYDSDLLDRYELYLDWRERRQRPSDISASAAGRIENLAGQIARTLQVKMPFLKSSTELKARLSDIESALLQSFSSHLCRRREGSADTGIMVGGKGVVLHKNSLMKKSEYFLALKILDDSESLVSWASGVSVSKVEREILPLSTTEQKLIVNKSTGKIQIREQKQWNGLPIGGAALRSATAQEIGEHLVELVLERRETLLRENESFGRWWQRWSFFCRFYPDKNFSSEKERAIWTEACFGENSLESLCSKDLVYFFESALAGEVRKDFHQQCPAVLKVPSGREVAIQYEDGKDPFVEVKLQELFGLRKAPEILNGKAKLSIVMLSPSRRPVQVTQDLENFWRHTYFEVRKELKARYPKHSWPDDPLTAPAKK